MNDSNYKKYINVCLLYIQRIYYNYLLQLTLHRNFDAILVPLFKKITIIGYLP